MVGIAVLLAAGCKPVAQPPNAAHQQHAGRLIADAAGGASAPPIKQFAAADQAQLRRAIAGYLADRQGRAGLMVQDLRTGVSFGYQEDGRFITASVAKVNILTGLLLERQAKHRELTSGERDLAAQMIRYSDNNAADTLYADAGQGRGIARIDGRIGMPHTQPYPTVWGATQTCPYDQVRLLHLLADPQSPLTPAHRNYVLNLMETVSSDQNWGISAAADEGETVALKNGWTPLHNAGSGWAVNSIGRITGPAHDFLIAVFTAEQPDMATGIRTVEHLADLTISTLRHTA